MEQWQLLAAVRSSLRPACFRSGALARPLRCFSSEQASAWHPRPSCALRCGSSPALWPQPHLPGGDAAPHVQVLRTDALLVRTARHHYRLHSRGKVWGRCRPCSRVLPGCCCRRKSGESMQPSSPFCRDRDLGQQEHGFGRHVAACPARGQGFLSRLARDQRYQRERGETSFWQAARGSLVPWAAL